MALLDVDAGELDDEPEELYAICDLVHVACGGHAGDEASMARVLAACKRLGTRAGAHPSFVDRDHFGRRHLDVAPALLNAQIEAQCAALAAIAAREGVTLTSMKPHGALYHAANADEAVAQACVGGAKRALGPIAIVASAGAGLEAAARALGCDFVREAFADRGMRPDGSLVPRGQPGDMVTDPSVAAAQARALVRRGDVDAICVHGDTPGAIAIARAVRATLGPRA